MGIKFRKGLDLEIVRPKDNVCKHLKKDCKHKLFVAFSIFMILVSIVGCSDKKIEKIDISSSETSYDINSSYIFDFNIEPEDAESKSIEFVTSDEEIVTLDKIDTNSFKVNTHKEGTATLYLKYDDGTSNKLTVAVVDVEKKLAEEKAKQEEEKKAEEERKAAEQAQREQEERDQAAQAQAETNNSVVETQTQTQAVPQEPTQIMVYATKTGSKYHNKPNCGNTKSATLVTLEAAQASGLAPCSKCY